MDARERRWRDRVEHALVAGDGPALGALYAEAVEVYGPAAGARWAEVLSAFDASAVTG